MSFNIVTGILFFLSLNYISGEGQFALGTGETCCAVLNVEGDSFPNWEALNGLYYLYIDANTKVEEVCIDTCVYKKLSDATDQYYCMKNYMAPAPVNTTCLDEEGVTNLGFNILTVNHESLMLLLIAYGLDPSWAYNYATLVFTIQIWAGYGKQVLIDSVLSSWGITIDQYINILAEYGFVINLDENPRIMKRDADHANVTCGEMKKMRLNQTGENILLKEDALKQHFKCVNDNDTIELPIGHFNILGDQKNVAAQICTIVQEVEDRHDEEEIKLIHFIPCEGPMVLHLPE